MIKVLFKDQTFINLITIVFPHFFQIKSISKLPICIYTILNGFTIIFTGTVRPEAVDDSIVEYDYDNANDVDEFCPSMPDNPEDGNYDEGELGEEGGYFPSQSILPTQTQGTYSF